MTTPHNLTKAQIKALRYFAPGCKREFSVFGNGPAPRTFRSVEALGLVAWCAGSFGQGRDETTTEGLRILAKIDAAKKSEHSA